MYEASKKLQEHWPEYVPSEYKAAHHVRRVVLFRSVWPQGQDQAGL